MVLPQTETIPISTMQNLKSYNIELVAIKLFMDIKNSLRGYVQTVA